ncbi:MAG: single-stranded DNA-binding protein [Gemmatimonadetes bacterium]|jgi:single-strand DNA-binding protein|nr:single-stranded DNA-binding protein [Gemmatimonadota bacterium]
MSEQLHVQQSVSGFIASAPQLSYTDRGDARFYVKIGQEHFTRNDDGTFTKQDTTFHDLVAYRRTAEHAHERFAKGDNFVAEGYVRDYAYTDAEGKQVEGSEFIARKIGHDLARTNYDVDRTRRTAAADRGVEAPAQAAPAQSATARAASMSI